jgi:hypothetical protein
LKTVQTDGGKIWWIVGGDDIGTLYGAYRFAEKLGVSFAPDEDVLPDEPLRGDWPDVDETAKPRFALRGIQPFHDFAVGPDWWNLDDYKQVLTQMAKMRMNFLGFHTYPSWNKTSGPEANVWIGLPEDVDAQGNVKTGYESGVATSRRGWGSYPYPSSKYVSGASLLFENDEYGPDFMLDCLDWPKTEQAAVDMFNRYGDLQQRAFEHARKLGVKTCLGLETPLGMPKMLAEQLKAKGMKPDEIAVSQLLYEGAFLRIMRKSPVDYFWLWSPESWKFGAGAREWEITTTENVKRDLEAAAAAAKAVKAPFGMATCGWMLGTREDPLWMHNNAPSDWAVSSINNDLGWPPLDKTFGVITGRDKWAIGWVEDDDTPGAAGCTSWDLQFWVRRMFENSADAAKFGCEGMMGILWRTTEITPNLMALAQAGWDFGKTPEAPDAELNTFWTDWGQGMFGGEAGVEAGRILQKLDAKHGEMNSLFDAKTLAEKIPVVFAPISELEALRPGIKGVGNLERFDYWLNLIQATLLRTETWRIADTLLAKVKEAKEIKDAEEQRRFVSEQILPLRLSLARGYEKTVAAFVQTVRTPGGLGVVYQMECAMQNRFFNIPDKEIEQMLGGPLPPEVTLSGAYRGASRIFVSGKCSQRNAGEQQEIRAFILSGPKCTGVNLYWRPLGMGAFQKVIAQHRARQAYRVDLPAQSTGTVEYYLEAVMEDGQKTLWPATAPAINQTVVTIE